MTVERDLAPLAERMRPLTLDGYVGQTQAIGPDTVLRRALAKGALPSLILWGPPGVGKTTLARLLARESGRTFHQLSAIHSGVKEVREVIDSVRKAGLFASKAVLFIDEIHRFSKSQQDSLLGAVEQGLVTLIGATTENPGFEVIPALRSRCTVVVLEPLNAADLRAIGERALAEDAELQARGAQVAEWEGLIRASGGDARKLLNVLEITVATCPEDDPVVTDSRVAEAARNPQLLHDRDGESHYNLASALIKSIRGSDPNAAIYYCARLIAGGEDPSFIARRLVISAAEDIGLANPTALPLAVATQQAVERIGMPEGRIPLAECVVYLATSPKSNTAYRAIDAALAEVRSSGDLAVPLHLRNAPTALMEGLGYGAGYVYDHDAPGGASGQEFLPEAVAGTAWYVPGENARERSIREALRAVWRGKYGY
jgi:putative ATPase